MTSSAPDPYRIVEVVKDAGYVYFGPGQRVFWSVTDQRLGLWASWGAPTDAALAEIKTRLVLYLAQSENERRGSRDAG